MKPRFILFRRGATFYSEDTTTGKQHSLRTKDEAGATILFNAKNESFRQPTTHSILSPFVRHGAREERLDSSASA